MNRSIIIGIALIGTALAALACDNTSGLSNAPRATFSQLSCLDNNDDNRISAEDSQPSDEIPDFNADDERDEQDTAFLQGVDIPLDPNRDNAACDGDAKRAPEYLVAHGYFEPSDVSCDDSDEAVLLVGIGGGVVNLREKDDAAGIRDIVDALQKEYDDDDVQTIGVIAGPAIVGAVNVHGGMEQWLTHAVRVYLERFACLRVVLVGHSHGAVTADVVGAALEDEYGERLIAIVTVDRVEQLYIGDLQSRPDVVPVFNVYETTDGRLRGDPYDSPNAENWDATAEEGPSDGEEGGDLEPVNHTTIDNSESVRERIVEEVIERS